MGSEQTQLQEVPAKERPIPSLPIVKQEQAPVQDSFTQHVTYLSSSQTEIHHVHSDLKVEEEPTTCPKAVLTTLMSSIPNLQGFHTMLDSSLSL